MPISRYPNTSVVDPTSLRPFNADATGVAATGTLQTILNVNGNGFLETFYGRQSALTAGFLLRITVDGVLKVSLGSSITKYVGVANKSDIRQFSTAGQHGISDVSAGNFAVGAVGQPSSIKPYPTTDGTDGLIVLASPIWFTKTLLLELQCNAANTLSYRYDGGYQ